MPIGFVFGGAGTRGDFQVGAARYLHDRGIKPDVITGSSGGAIVALKLSEGGDAVVEAETLLRGLRSPASVYGLRPWAIQLANAKAEADQLHAWVEQNAVFLGLLTLGVGPAALLGFPMAPFLAGAAAAVAPFATAGGGALNDDAMYDARPLRMLLRSSVDQKKVAESGIKLRLGVVGVESAVLRFVTETGRFADDPAETAEHSGCRALREQLRETQMLLYSLDEQIRTYQEPTNKSSDEWDALLEERDATQQRFDDARTQLAELGCPETPRPRLDLIEAAVASGAMPGFFAPVTLDGERFVDGGIRSLLPLKAAVEAGADRVFAIYPKPDLEMRPISHGFRILQYLSRSIDLMLEEQRVLETKLVQDSGVAVTHIQPSRGLEVHAELEVEPGLTAISIGYGYMRAADEMSMGLPALARTQMRLLSDLITLSRLRCWRLEFLAAGMNPAIRGMLNSPSAVSYYNRAPMEDVLLDIRMLKWTIYKLVEYRRGLTNQTQEPNPVPIDAGTWSSRWEPHDFTAPTASVWDAYRTTKAATIDTFTSGGVTVQEVDRRGEFGPALVVLDGIRYQPSSAYPLSRSLYVVAGSLAFLQFGGTISVPVPEPTPKPESECDQLRAEIGWAHEMLAENEREQLRTNDPDALRRLNEENGDLSMRLQTMLDRSRELGCP